MFSNIDDERLIELVRQQPILYDLANPKYLDSARKFRIWTTIGSELGKEASECKQRWGNIRDQYKKSLKKEVTRSGQAASQIRPYKYKLQLSFLNATFIERDTLTNLEQTGTEVNDPNNNLESSDDDEEQPMDVSDSQNATTSKKIASKKKFTPYMRKRGSRDEKGSASAKLMEYLIAKKSTSTTEPHPVDAFLAGIAPVLKSLDNIKMHKARSEIFEVVQRYELDMLLENTNSQLSYAVSRTQPISSTPEPETEPLFEPSFVGNTMDPEPDAWTEPPEMHPTQQLNHQRDVVLKGNRCVSERNCVVGI